MESLQRDTHPNHRAFSEMAAQITCRPCRRGLAESYGTGVFLTNLRSGSRDGRVLANLRLNAYCIIESVGPLPPSGTAVARNAK